MTQVFCSFLVYLVGDVAKVLVVLQVQVQGSNVSFLCANQNENQNIQLIKNNRVISFCRKSL